MTADELRTLLVDPSTGILSRMLGTMGNLSTRLTELENREADNAKMSAIESYQSAVDEKLAALKRTFDDELAALKDDCMQSVAQLSAEVEKLVAAKPAKRSRSARKETEQDLTQKVAAPAEEPAPATDVFAPEPATETVDVAPVIDGIRMTQSKVLSLRNDVRVLQGPALVLQLNPELTENALNFAIGLTEEQARQLPQE